MDLIQKSIHMDQIKCQAGTQITLEDDINITDAKPDVYQLVTEQGQIDLEEVRAMEDHVHVKGALRFRVLYISEEEGHRPACMEGTLPFEERVFLDGAEASDSVTVRTALEDLSVGMINSRKLSVQALLNLELSVEKLVETCAAVGLEDEGLAEVRRKTLQPLSLIIDKKDIFRVRREVELPAGMPNIFSLLWQSCRLKEVSFKIQDEKMLLQGELSLFFLYEGEGEERQTFWYETTVAIGGTVECQGMREGMLEDIRCRIGHREIEVKADEDGEERRIALELVLELDMKLYEETRIEVISDLYGVTRQIEAVRQTGLYRRLIIRNTGKTRAGGHVRAANGVPRLQQLCGSFGWIELDKTEPSAEGLKITGAVHVQLLCTTEDPELPFYCLKGALHFSYTMETADADGDCLYRVEPQLEQLDASLVDGEEAEVKAVLSLRGLVCRICREEMVSGVQVGELDPERLAALPGIVVYIVQDGDSLWSIGKKYYVPVECMKEMNDLPGEEVKSGDKLLIVKGTGI
ncbi:MAG: DUF3794 domain-containing protein [Eubacteriales bacterium]|nr:DUF3794 domain-containing protein [Eubacteriales bacterium]